LLTLCIQHCKSVSLVRPTLSYGNKSWTVIADERRLMATEIIFMRTDRHTVSNCKRNYETSTNSSCNRIYRTVHKKLKEYADRMTSGGNTEKVVKCQLKGKSGFRTCLKQWNNSVL
jgi:hypothetical protein